MIIHFVDCETTGLDPSRHQIVEFAGAVYDTASRSITKRAHAVLHVLHWREFEDAAEAMHRASGLFNEAYSYGTALHTATFNARIRGFFKSSSDAPTLGGNSVHFDLGFLRAMGLRLSHRVINVSTLRDVMLDLGAWAPEESAPRHRAQADVEHSISIYERFVASVRVEARGDQAWLRSVWRWLAVDWRSDYALGELPPDEEALPHVPPEQCGLVTDELGRVLRCAACTGDDR